EREREVVVARSGRIERRLLVQHVFGAELERERSVLVEESRERGEQLVTEANDGGIVPIVEAAGLERAPQLVDPGRDRLDGGVLFARSSLRGGMGFGAHAETSESVWSIAPAWGSKRGFGRPNRRLEAQPGGRGSAGPEPKPRTKGRH